VRLWNSAILSLLAWCSGVVASVDDGQFAIKGMGLATCERFVEARSAQSREYFQFGG